MAYYIYNLLTTWGVFVILGMSFNLLLGYTGLFSVAHAAVFGLGAYTTSLLTKTLGLDFLVALAIAVAFTVLVSLGLGFASLRVYEEYLVIASLAFHILVVELFNNLTITGRSAGLMGIPRPAIFGFRFDTPLKLLILTWLLAALMALLTYRLVHSPLGRVLRSVREDERSARALGKNTVWAKVVMFALTSGMAAVAGGIFAGYIRFISPAEFGLERSITILSLTIIGGLAAYWGPLVGAAVTVFIPQILVFFKLSSAVAASVNAVIYSALVLLFLLFRPQGILGRRQAVVEGEAAEAKSRRGPGAAASSEEDASPTVVELPALRPAAADATDAEAILKAEGLRKAFGGLVAVDGLTLHLYRKTVVGLVGPNGAGKTTAFNLLTGFLPADTGQVYFKGEDITCLTPEQRAQRGLVRSFQDVRLFGGISVMDNMLLALTPVRDEGVTAPVLQPATMNRHEKARVAQAQDILAYLGLYRKREAMAHDLSYAEQKLLVMGRLLAIGADCYLLDEPMAGLDLAERERMNRLVQEIAASGKAVCLVEHNMDVVREVCPRVVFLNLGRPLAEGSPEEIMGNRDLGDLYFGTRFGAEEQVAT